MELGEGMEHVETMHIHYSCIDAQLRPEKIKPRVMVCLRLSSERELDESSFQSHLNLVNKQNATSV